MKILHWREIDGRTGHGSPLEDLLCDSAVDWSNDNDKDGTKYWSEPVGIARTEE